MFHQYVAQASIAEEISRNAYVDTLSESAQLKAHADPLRNKPLQDSSWYQSKALSVTCHVTCKISEEHCTLIHIA